MPEYLVEFDSDIANETNFKACLENSLHKTIRVKSIDLYEGGKSTIENTPKIEAYPEIAPVPDPGESKVIVLDGDDNVLKVFIERKGKS